MLVNRKELESAISRAKAAIDKTSHVGNAGQLYLNGEEISGAGFDVAISVSCETGITGMVDAERFFQVVSSLQADEIELGTSDDKTFMTLTCKGHKSRFQLIEGQFPAVRDYQAEFSSVPRDLAEALDAVHTTISKSNPALSGVVFTSDGSVVTTDGYRMSWYRMSGSLPAGKKGLMLSTRAVGELRGLKDLDMVSVGEKTVLFKTKGEKVWISCARIWMDYFPKWRKLFPENLQELEFSPINQTGLNEALRRIGVCGGMTVQTSASLTFFDDAIEISYEVPSGGLAMEERVEGKALPIAPGSGSISPVILSDALGRCSELAIIHAVGRELLIFRGCEGKYLLAAAMAVEEVK